MAKPPPSYTGANCVGSLKDRAPTASQSIIRHHSRLQRICSRMKSVREFYMHCFVQKRDYERQSKNYLSVFGGKWSLFHSVKAEADVQYLCVCLKTCYITASDQPERLDQAGELGCKKEGKIKRGGKKSHNSTPNSVHLLLVEPFSAEQVKVILKI